MKPFRRSTIFYAAGLVWLVTILAIHAVLFSPVFAGPRDPFDAHRYADRVLAPRFQADYNAWSYEHPRDPEGREWDHARRLDAGDVERWRVVRERWRELDEAMKRAGYK